MYRDLLDSSVSVDFVKYYIHRDMSGVEGSGGHHKYVAGAANEARHGCHLSISKCGYAADRSSNDNFLFSVSSTSASSLSTRSHITRGTA